jgi:transposase
MKFRALNFEHHKKILNFFINGSTSAFAESFNAKIKTFRASLKGGGGYQILSVQIDRYYCINTYFRR